jgi:tripartite-type tricarboxylate transporter receptor subunit TctC
MGALAALPFAAQAQPWAPDRPIRMIVPFAAGGSTDVTARMLAQALSGPLGQPVVIENRPGAGGNIGAEAAARSAPDGHTLFMATSGIIGANSALYRRLPFDPLRDFAPISLVSFVPNLIVVNPELPVRDLAELIAYAKARPGQVNYGSAGAGTSLHLSSALFAARAGLDMVHVPYRGGAPAATDLIAGKIQMIASPMSEVLANVQAGTLRPIAVTTARRSSALPQVPTVGEVIPGFEIALWNGIIAPAGTPAAAVARFSTALNAILRDGPVRRTLLEQGSEPAPNTPEEFAAFMRADLLRWAEVVKVSGASAD